MPSTDEHHEQPISTAEFHRSGEKPRQPKDHEDRKSRPPYTLDKDKEGKWEAKYRGQCYCGNVKFEIDEDPLDGSYCHCRTCQRLHGAPYQWAAIFHKNAVRFTSGEDQLHFYSPQEKKLEYTLPCKISCGLCQSPIADEGRNMLLLFPTLVEGMNEDGTPLKDNGPFRATHHMFYSSRVEDIHDDLPKFAGKKGDRPLNSQGQEMAQEQQAKREKKDRQREDAQKSTHEQPNKKQKA